MVVQCRANLKDGRPCTAFLYEIDEEVLAALPPGKGIHIRCRRCGKPHDLVGEADGAVLITSGR